MTRYLILLSLVAVAACGNPQPDPNHPGEVDMSTTGLTRLMRYYPLDTTISAQGDTVVKYHTIPNATFTTQSGKPFSAAQHRNVISVSNFFFSTCTGICPVVTNQMTRIQAAFANNQQVKFVSYTVDPEVDSVPVLAEYARRFKADTAQWTFLTGTKKALYDQIRYGFYLPDVEVGSGDAEDFIHSDQLVLVDRDLVIRGYYTGTDSAAVDSLIQDMQLLLIEKN